MAAILLAALGATVLCAIIFQFVLWLKVRYDHRASVLEWKGVIESAVSDIEEARQTFATFREKQAELEASQTALKLKQQALEESFAHFNAKTIARAREEAKSARKEARSAEAEAEKQPPADAAEAIAQALAEQQALQINGAAVPAVPNVPRRLVPKRIGQ